MTEITKQFIEVFSTNCDKVAIDDSQIQLTYSQLKSKVENIITNWEANTLQNKRVFFLIRDRIHLLCCYLASIFSNVVVIPVNPGITKSELTQLINWVKPAAIVEDKELKITQFNKTTVNHKDQFDVIFFSSGSTGRPKGICHNFTTLLANAEAFNKDHGLSASTRLLHCMPMYYMAGFLNTILSPLLCGGTIVLAPQFSPLFVSRFWNFARNHQVNTCWLSPAMLAFLVRLNRNSHYRDWAEKNIIKAFIGTAALTPELKENTFSSLGLKSLASYGLSEVGLVSGQKRFLLEDDSVGDLLPLVTVELTHENRINISSPYRMQGYLNNDGDGLIEQTNGYFKTDDLGYKSDKHLYITGRLNDVIIRGGRNISSRNIVSVLLEHPAVVEAEVIGRPHQFWGEEVVAFVVCTNTIDQQALTAFCQTKLQVDEVPSQICFIKQLPKSPTGKIMKGELLESIRE